jgi:hypothetical protein
MTTIKIKNRSKGSVGYTIPELGDKRDIHRHFSAGETKNIPIEEFHALEFIPGGLALIEKYLQIEDMEELQKMNINVEREYFMSEEDIIELLNHGSLDAFLDALDFAPEGVIDLIEQYSVELPLNDYQKRQALLKKTGFNVDNALRIKAESAEEDEAPAPTKQRRVQAEEPKTRRTNYKVVSREDN